jgi:hypothetical protein
LKIIIASRAKDPHTVVILVHVRKNLVKDVLVDGGCGINIITKDCRKKLSLPTPRLTSYTLKMVDHTLTKPVRLVWVLKILIHGILYVVTITLLELEMDSLVLTTETFGVDFGTKDLTFDFPHNLDEIKVDATPMCIEV